jgi:transposase-like protein
MDKGRGRPSTLSTNKEDISHFVVEYGHLGGVKLAAIELIATKRYNKKTYVEIAAEVGVDTATLYRWRNYNSEFQEALLSMSKAIFMAGVPDVYEFLHDVVRNGSHRDGTNAARLNLQAAGMLVDKQEVVVKEAHSNVDAIIAEYEEID